MKQYRFIIRTLLVFLLMIAGLVNHAWATNVTYHILTLPIDNSIYHMKSEISGKRLEAFKVTVNGQSTLELPAVYKSPLATGFTYYAASDVTKSGSAVKLFDATNNQNKGYTYVVNGEDTSGDTSDDATPVAEGTPLSGSTADYYVVYTYNSSNTIAQLNGSVKYNIKTIGYNNKGEETEKGFFAYNRGRNNRPAVLPKTKVDAEILASEDFVKVDVTGTSVAKYWSSGDNKNKEEITGSKFHFIFKFEGVDPYNIIIRTAYNRDTTYIEKNDNTNPAEFVYKYYKEGSLFSNGTANTYFASDEHRHYNYAYNSSLAENPTNLTEGSGTGWDDRNGYYHGQNGTIWNSFALLNNSKFTGYVFVGTRTVDGSGNTPDAPSFLKEANSCNNLVINKISQSDATNNLSIEGLYPIKTVTFKVKTPFYAVEESDAHIVSATANISQYTIDNDNIDDNFIPDELRRKYCTFTTTYRNSDGDVITKYSQMKSDGVIFLEYNVSESLPFKAIAPAASYNADTWKSATWYELTDDKSTQADGKKLNFNSPNFKNNGAADAYEKTSEFAFIGDPYELRVVYRNATSGDSPSYVGVATVSTGTDLTTSTTASAGYKWEMPYDATAGSFLLRNYKDANNGYWRWDADHVNETRSYATKSGQTVDVANSEAQTITLNITGFAGGEGHYFKITAAGTNPEQIDSSAPELGTGMGAISGTEGTATITLKSSGGVAKSFTLSIQEYDRDNAVQGSPCDITINQGATPYAGNNIEYSTAGSTRIKLMELPKRNFTYKIIDKAGNIAIQATVSQTVFSPLNGFASIPEVIRSPFLSDETITYYNAYSGGGRGNLLPADVIEEVPNADDAIFVKYTTVNLDTKSIHLNADEEKQKFNVKLNGSYIYYEGGVIKSKDSPTPEELALDSYIWCLRNRDPYNMMIDNIAARASSSTEPVDIYDDDGGTTTASKAIGGWVRVADGTWGNDKALGFTSTRAEASHFIAMMSNYVGIYEVMAATGDDNYYHIGRTTETKIYSVNTTGYAHGDDALRFELFGKNPIIYHLIDKEKNDLLQVTSNNPRLALPADYVSPLVGTYYYYPTKALAEADVNNGLHEGNITEPAQITDEGNNVWVTYTVNNLIGFNNSGKIDDHPYLLRFLQPFEEGYYLEDGNDGLISSKLKAIYPYTNGDGSLNIYGEKMRNEQMDGGSSTRSRWVWFFESAHNDPYHVRLHSRNTISYNSTSYPTYLQTREVHFKQDTDPDAKHIVTGGALPGISAEPITEYMILGLEGQYRLRTTNEIGGARHDVKTLEQYWKTYNMVKLKVLGISSSTDAYSTDESTWVVPEDKRADLKTALQRLKYTATDVSDMISQINAFTSTGVYYFRIGTSSYEYKKITVTAVATVEPAVEAVYSEEACTPSTWEGPNYVDGWIWHSYDDYANATRWNGYNDKSDGHEKKVVEKLEHWYQTFDMGNGSFDVETAVIPPVLVLLDRHGWEIMRKPLPDKSTYPYDAERQAALKVYDSPLVKEYRFYSNASKAYSSHKYALRLDDNTKAERDQIKVDGVQYTSTSLADLPPITATGVLSSGVLNDQYVIYTVKDEYEDNYDYNLTLNKEEGTFTETGESQPYLVLQHGRFYKTPNNDNQSYISKPIYEHTVSGTGNVYDLIVEPVNKSGNDDIVDGSENWKQNNFWRVKPNLDIDEEMGIIWTSETDTTKLEPYTRYLTKDKYKNKTGFDPYNIQLQLINKNDGSPDGRYLTTHMTSTRIVNGAMEGDYSGSGGTVKITLETRRDATDPEDANLVHSEGYDHSDIKMTNQTFMAVSDADGNMQLMPRFDHTLRVDLANTNPWETTLKAPKDNGKKASADDNSSMGSQTTFFVRPQRFHYHIIDNFGREALRYKRGGDFYPTITDHFKSPLAKDYTYYTGLAEHEAVTSSNADEWGASKFKRTATTETLRDNLINLLPTSDTYYYRTGTRGAFSYSKVEVTKGFEEQKITGSLADAGLTGTDCHVYVRYNYDEDADNERDRILQGQWLTVKLANKDLQAYGTVVTAADEKQGTGVDLYSGTKPGTIDKDAKVWQWKFLQAPADPSSDYYEAPDPYAIRIFNRNANYTVNPSLEPSPMAVGIKVPKANDGADRFALLSHPDGGYALVVAKNYADYNYKFLNGAEMTTPTTHAATTYIENRQQMTVSSEDYETEKSKLPSDIDEEYFFKINHVAYMVVSVSGGTPGSASESSKIAWDAATGKFKKTATNATDLENQRTKLSGADNGDYYFKVTSYSVTYKKVTIISGVKTETDSSDAEWNTGTYRFTYNTNALSPGAQVLVNNDVVYNFEYKVVNNSLKLAVSDYQTTEEAAYHEYFPYLPEAIQTPLLNMEDYKYYGFATVDDNDTDEDSSDDTYTVIPQTLLYTLAGLYDDVVWVRYDDYSMDKTPFKVPNKRNDTSASVVARDPSSVDVSMNINGGLPYNIIWEDDNMMASDDGTRIDDGGSQTLSGDAKYVWLFEGNDPYNLKIKHKNSGKYIYNYSSIYCQLDGSNFTPFMLLKKSGHDYGILQVTGTGTTSDDAQRLTGWGNCLTSGGASTDPEGFIIFGLSVHDLIYRLIIAKTCVNTDSPGTGEYVDIPYMTAVSGTPDTKRIYGTTQRDLTTGSGATYQLGETINIDDGTDITPYNYCVDAGAVSIGDLLQVPNEFNRPNCTYEFYIDGVWDDYNSSTKTISTENVTLNGLYKGIKLDEESPRLMSDADLINKVVRVNIVYSFNQDLATNNGMDFVRSTDDKCWYTYETSSGGTPYLAHYTNAWGMQSMGGRETRYTNDYLWTPVGDVYGFKLYNRYMIKNSDGSDKVMTYAGTVDENKKLVVAEPGSTVDAKTYTSGNEVFELLPGDMDGYFRVHPVVNNSGTQYYVRRKDTPGDIDSDGNDDLDYTILSTTPCDWTFGLDMSLMAPYYERAGYVGGLTATGKTAYETAVTSGTIMDIQHVVYDDDNIINFTSGYYRMHNQPGVSGISPVRYASGYLHDIEKTAGESSTAIPMHFYSKAGVNTTFQGEGGLEEGFTITDATRGDIPVVSTELDPSTIFYINGSVTGNKTISEATMSTQGLNVLGNKMTTGTGTTFTLIDIGGAVFLIVDKLDPGTRQYLNFDQTSNIYDLKFMHDSPTDDAKWCLKPVQKTATVGNGEMPLKITTNNGGDGYYYSTLYLPYDVLLPADAGGKTYNAYICKKWYNEGVNPVAVPEITIAETTYGESKFVPAGTPVIIRTNDDSKSVTLTLPNSSPSSSLTGNIFSGEYLEQLLAVDASHYVYTLGLPMTSDVDKADDYNDTGEFVAPRPDFANSGVGFYINATPNKEKNALKANWTRNNRYVLHNKIYYRASGGSGVKRFGNIQSVPQFVPVIFDYEEEGGELQPDGQILQQQYDGDVYDLSGRKVATEDQVKDGTWKQSLRPGIYIVGGKKIKI